MISFTNYKNYKILKTKIKCYQISDTKNQIISIQGKTKYNYLKNHLYIQSENESPKNRWGYFLHELYDSLSIVYAF